MSKHLNAYVGIYPQDPLKIETSKLWIPKLQTTYKRDIDLGRDVQYSYLIYYTNPFGGEKGKSSFNVFTNKILPLVEIRPLEVGRKSLETLKLELVRMGNRLRQVTQT